MSMYMQLSQNSIIFFGLAKIFFGTKKPGLVFR